MTGIQSALEGVQDGWSRFERALAAIWYFNAWPEYLHSFADKVGQEPQMRRPRPGPRQITEAEEAMLWLRWLEKDDAGLVWLRANGKPWKQICRELGISRATANRRLEYGRAGSVMTAQRSNRSRQEIHAVRDLKGAWVLNRE